MLGAGPAQVGLLQAAAARGVPTIAVDRDPHAVGFAHATERALISTEDEVAVERLARARRVAGIVSPGADWTVGVAARVAERAGLPHPISAATAAIATSKPRQRVAFADAGVPHATEIDPAAPRFPCVVKAPDRQGQRGLTLVRDPAELAAALAVARAEARSGPPLVEELVDGPELTVNAFVSDGVFVPLTVTDRLLAEPPAFGVARAHAWPSERETTSVVRVAEAASRAVGIESGPVYVQVRVSSDGPVVMEVAARLGGGHDAELCQAALGVDLNGLAIDAALGEPASVKLTQADPGAVGGACVVFLVPPVGALLEVDGLDDADAVEGVRWVRSYRSPGWRFGEFRRGADRAGAVLAVGDDREQALERAGRAAGAVRFRVDAATA